MDGATLVALIGGVLAVAAAAARVGYSLLEEHRRAIASRFLELQANGKTYEIDLDNIVEVRSDQIKRAADAIRAEKAKWAA